MDEYREDELNPLDPEMQDIDYLLDQLSFNTVQTNIEHQISGELESGRDFLEVLMSKVETILSSLTDRELVQQIRDEYATFCEELSRMIIEKYDLACSVISEEEICDDLLETLYGFFIKNHYDYTNRFLCAYIFENKDYIYEQLDLKDKSDIVTIANKKKGIDEVTVAIISNIGKVIDFVVNQLQITPQDFLNTINDGELYIENLIEFYDNCQIDGNFVSQYLEEITSDPCSDDALKLRNDVRVELYMEMD